MPMHFRLKLRPVAIALLQCSWDKELNHQSGSSSTQEGLTSSIHWRTSCAMETVSTMNPPKFFLLLLLLQRTQTSISILNQSNIYFIYIHTLAIGRWASPAAWSKRDTETQSPPYEFLFPPLRSLSLSSFVPFFFLFPSSSSLDRTAWGCVCVALSKCEGTERCRCNTRTARRRFLNHTPRRDHLDRLINKETIRISVNTMMITAHSPLNESRQSSSFLLWMWPILYCTRKLHYSMSRQGFLIKRQRKFESCHILFFKSTPRRQPLMMVMGPITMEATRS